MDPASYLSPSQLWLLFEPLQTSPQRSVLWLMLWLVHVFCLHESIGTSFDVSVFEHSNLAISSRSTQRCYHDAIHNYGYSTHQFFSRGDRSDDVPFSSRMISFLFSVTSDHSLFRCISQMSWNHNHLKCRLLDLLSQRNIVIRRWCHTHFQRLVVVMSSLIYERMWLLEMILLTLWMDV